MHATPSPRVARILIVDDSAVMRALLRGVVGSDPRLEVAGTASDGHAALRAVDSLHPDLVLLDVEMPGMDGVSTLRQMKAKGKHTPVIMCSSLTQLGAKVTIEALASGASDYVAKPSGQRSREAAMQTLAQDLIPKILALTALATASVPLVPAAVAAAVAVRSGAFGGIAPLASSVARSGRAAAMPIPGIGPLAQRPEAASSHSLHQPSPRPAVPASGLQAGLPQPSQRPATTMQVLPASVPAVVLIGVSTGGPAALDSLLPAIPSDFPLPILVVQHMPELFTSLLAERLNGRCPLRVCEATSGEPVRRGSVYIARGGWHMEVTAAERLAHPPAPGTPAAIATLRLTQEPLENHCRPAVDVLFRTAVSVFGARVLGVVLTGMGYDGLAGSRVIREHGGTVLAQDQATSAVWGMPGAVAQAGLAHRILPLNSIASEILRLAGRSQREALELRESTVNSCN